MDRNLVQFEGTPEELKDELSALLRQRKEEALRNLVTGKTPKKVVLRRPVRGGGEVDYVPGWWFDQQMNGLFNHLWSHEIKDKYIGEHQVWTLDKVTVHLPGMSITETKPDGTVIETKFEPLNIVKEQFGSSDIKKYTKNPPQGKQVGDIIDIGDDLKASATDGKKKACTAFGLAEDVYGPRENAEAVQSNILLVLGKKKGMTPAQVETWCFGETGKHTDALSESERLAVIAKLRAK